MKKIYFQKKNISFFFLNKSSLQKTKYERLNIFLWVNSLLCAHPEQLINCTYYISIFITDLVLTSVLAAVDVTIRSV